MDYVIYLEFIYIVQLRINFFQVHKGLRSLKKNIYLKQIKSSKRSLTSWNLYEVENQR